MEPKYTFDDMMFIICYMFGRKDELISKYGLAEFLKMRKSFEKEIAKLRLAVLADVQELEESKRIQRFVEKTLNDEFLSMFPDEGPDVPTIHIPDPEAYLRDLKYKAEHHVPTFYVEPV